MSEQLIKETSQVVKAPVNLPSPAVAAWAGGSAVPTLHLARRMVPAGLRWTSVDMGSSQCRGSPEQKAPVFYWTQGLGGGRGGKGWEWKSSEYWVREENSVLEISHSSPTRRSRQWHLRKAPGKEGCLGWERGCSQEHGWPAAWVLGAVPLETVMHGLCPESGVGGLSPVRSAVEPLWLPWSGLPYYT